MIRAKCSVISVALTLPVAAFFPAGHRVVLENVRINGTLVASSNVADFFDINSFVWGVRFDSGSAMYPLTPCRVLDTGSRGAVRRAGDRGRCGPRVHDGRAVRNTATHPGRLDQRHDYPAHVGGDT